MGLLSRTRGREIVVVTPQTPGPASRSADAPAHGSSTVTRPVREASDWAWRLIVVAIASAALILGLIQLKTVVVPVLVATLVAALLAPLAAWFHGRLRLPRVLAVIATMVVALGAVAGLVALAGNAIVQGLPELKDRAIAGFEDALDWLSSGPLGLDEATLRDWLQQVQDQLSSNTDQILSGALSLTSSAGHVAAGALIAIFCLFFFLLEGRVIWAWLVGLFPQPARARVDGAGLRSWISLGAYTRTQILVALVDGIGIGVGAWILGVPLPIPLGILVFIGSFIPIVGALITGSVAVAVALVDGGPLTALGMLAFVLAVQQIEGHLLQPLLMSRALKLHPVAVLLAVATGTLVGGIVGALLAVPIVAVSNTALKYLNGRDPISDTLKDEFEELTNQWQQS